MKLPILLLALLLGTNIIYAYDSDSEEQANSRGRDGQPTNCVFRGCSCGEEEPYFTSETDYTETSEGGPYGIGYDVICKLDEDMDGARVFPERDSSKKYSNVISSIEVNSNRMEEIPDDRFNNLEISVADFSNNDLSALSGNVFRGIVKLEVLDLSKNKLNDLNEDTFTPIAATLIQLKLNENHLNRVASSKLSQVLSNLDALKTLTLRHNQLTELPDLSKMKKLEELALTHNQIESIYDETNGKQLLPSTISDLNLENNKLKHIKESTFVNLNNLKYLNLESNQIASIDDNSFAHLTRLSTLNLGKNYIKHIPSMIFYTLVNLDRLDLSSQNQMLKEIDDYAFDRSSNTQIIRKVDLSKNRIARISNKAFCSRNRTYPYVNIREIDLAANHLTGLNACILRQLSKGFSDFQNLKISQSVSISNQQSFATQRPKVSFKPAHFAEKMGPYVKCDCEISKALRYVDFDGECEVNQGTMSDLKGYQCPNLAGLTNENIEQECSSQVEFDCQQKSGDEPPRPVKPDSVLDGKDKDKKPADRDRAGLATKSPSSSAENNSAQPLRLISSSFIVVLTLLLSSTLVWL